MGDDWRFDHTEVNHLIDVGKSTRCCFYCELFMFDL